MSPEGQKAVVRRFFEEGLNKANADVADELLTPDFVSHFAGMPEPVRGTAHWKHLAAAYFTAFPDMHLTVEHLIAEGDKVVARWTWRGTHAGAFMGMPPTGKQVTVTGSGLYRIVDGRIAVEWVNDDVLGLMQQLGAVPAPGQAGS